MSGKELKASVEEELKEHDTSPVSDYPIDLAGVLTKVGNLHLPVPTQVEHREKYDWPLDITKESGVGVRNLLSYYTAQFSYANYSLARLKFLISKVESEIKERERILRSQLYRTGHKRDEIAGLLEEDKKIKRLRNTLLHGEGVYNIVLALADSYKQYISAASRELSVRENEFRFAHTRPGEGK
jgi:hypothetical protein